MWYTSLMLTFTFSHAFSLLSACISLEVVVAISIVVFLLGVVGGAIGGPLVVYCAHYYKARRGKLDLSPAGAVYEDVSRPAPAAPLYEDVGATPPATAASSGPQLELKENVAYGHVGTR